MDRCGAHAGTADRRHTTRISPACYSDGRDPRLDPTVAAHGGRALCQIREDVSDQKAARRVAKDLDWKRALDVEADEIPFHTRRCRCSAPG